MNFKLLPNLVILFYLFSGVCYASNTILEENFDDGNFIGWTEFPALNEALCANAWSVEGGILKARILQYSCSTNLYPSDTLWGILAINMKLILICGWCLA